VIDRRPRDQDVAEAAVEAVAAGDARRLVEQRLGAAVGKAGTFRPGLGAQRHHQRFGVARPPGPRDQTDGHRPVLIRIGDHAPVYCVRLMQEVVTRIIVHHGAARFEHWLFDA
jgi:hypothetical protein